MSFSQLLRCPPSRSHSRIAPPSLVPSEIHREPLPAYAPDLNPVEWLWRHLKLVEMANLTCLDLEQLHMELHLALGRVREKRRLIPSFFEGAGLAL